MKKRVTFGGEVVVSRKFVAYNEQESEVDEESEVEEGSMAHQAFITNNGNEVINQHEHHRPSATVNLLSAVSPS